MWSETIIGVLTFLFHKFLLFSFLCLWIKPWTFIYYIVQPFVTFKKVLCTFLKLPRLITARDRDAAVNGVDSTELVETVEVTISADGDSSKLGRDAMLQVVLELAQSIIKFDD